MKTLLLRYLLAIVMFSGTAMLYAQTPDIVLQSGNYDKDPYPAYNPNGSITGTYSIQIAKSAHTFTAGQFTINIAFPLGAVYAGGGTIPAGFSVLSGQDGSSSVVIEISGNWSGTGPTAIRNFVLPIKLVAPAVDQPTVTALQWLDPFVTENPAGNSTGSPLNVNNVLPVTLADFTVAKEGQTAGLNWVTTGEVNSDYFEVQHSREGQHWTALGRVESHKDSKMRNEYRYTHATPVSGLNYYRLKMVDRDLSYDYSPIKSIRMEGVGTALVKVFPNPVSSGPLTIETAGELPVKRIEVINSAGLRVYTAEGGKASTTLRVDDYPAGIYLTRVVYEDGSSSTHRVVVAK